MFWMGAFTLRGEVGGGWALEFLSFLGPVKWERADRRVPFRTFKLLFAKNAKYFPLTPPMHEPTLPQRYTDK